ncbi:hypothetical protein SS1G_02485 [Sclerotinia sclerotiorum 1980 UF-70]|uniref:Uncharacterized protein n=1 Tax=Sclerotinia sclerotiorum (strain ATCC 18683 / 1980 / Ss-1) TaxID=665079 RepID=A7EAZ9_SCLS1|nr:hypothetical protein SS1G_02485 [Sclerotinia sclerotiorum 1980 UF-70]EDN99627.1 hypothetical protein SS1G_02485 [Sclerotinia sclerotiorum 1980 UF-70]
MSGDEIGENERGGLVHFVKGIAIAILSAQLCLGEENMGIAKQKL